MLDALDEVDLLERLDHQKRCANSPHPDHTHCGQPAAYVIHGLDAKHDWRWSKFLCGTHVYVTYLIAAGIGGEWCECSGKHRRCVFSDVTVDRL